MLHVRVHEQTLLWSAKQVSAEHIFNISMDKLNNTSYTPFICE